MSYGISLHPIIPGRAEPSDKAEMVTQLLFGQSYKVLEIQKKWVLIEIIADNYTCWIDRKQHNGLSEKNSEHTDTQNLKRCGDALGRVTDQNGLRFFIPCGSPLPAYREGNFSINGQNYEYDGRIARHDSDSVVRHAKRLIHAPYLWGGKSALGIDCSGLTQVVMACAGISIPRDAYQQATLGEGIDFIALAQPGDLAFFDNEEGKIIHVGIILENAKIIHASGSVRIDTLDHQGIYNDNTKEYSHKLRLIKRLSLAEV